MDIVAILAAASAALVLLVLVLVWLLLRPTIAVAFAPRQPAGPPAPPKPDFVKCNARRFHFEPRPTEDGAHAIVEMHPVCEHIPLESMTEDAARRVWEHEHPDKPWVLVEVADAVHYLRRLV